MFLRISLLEITGGSIKYKNINEKSGGKAARYYPVGIYLPKVKNRNIRTRCKICSKLTIKTSD